MAYQANDVPCANGQPSEALALRLTGQDLFDIAASLKYRGVRTLRALESLDTNDRAVLLGKIRDLYAVYGLFPSHLQHAVDNLLTTRHLPQQPEEGWGRPLQPGCVGTTASVHIQATAHVICASVSSAASA